MRVRRVFTFWDGTPQREEQLQTAFETASFFEARLIVAAVAYDSQEAIKSTCDEQWMHTVEEAKERVREIYARFKTEDISGDAFPLVTTRSNLADHINVLRDYADVSVQVPATSRDRFRRPRSAVAPPTFNEAPITDRPMGLLRPS